MKPTDPGASHFGESAGDFFRLKDPRMTIEAVPVANIKESPFNRRRVWNMDELEASVREHGILQPPLGRKVNGEGEVELVFGHRRFRAANAVGLEWIPVDVRELGDKEALELIAVENGQREDIHPLDEAELYKELHDRHNVSLEGIAAKIGKGLGYVRQRLKLLDLGEPAKKAFLAGQLSPSLALLVARVPVKLQADAVKELLPTEYRGAPTLKLASESLQRRFMLVLSEAKFDRNDPDLVAGAGSCGACPKRTGNQPELFADVKSKDLCTDPTCFEAKRDAGWKRAKAEAEAAGRKVLSESASKKLFPHGDHMYSSEYIDLDATCHEAGNKKWKTVLGKKVTPALARDAHGGVHELVDVAQARKVLKEVLPKAAASLPRKQSSSGGGDMKKWQEQQKKRREKEEAEQAVRGAVLGAIVAAAAKREPSEAETRLLVETMIRDSGYGDTAIQVAERRGIDCKGTNWKALVDASKKLKGGELRALGIEIILTAACESGREAEAAKLLGEACAFYKVDRKAVEKAFAAERAAKTAAPPAAKGKPAGKKKGAPDAPRVEGVCRVCRCTEDHACDTPDGPCSWVEHDLCSACADVPAKPKKKGGRKA